MASLALQRLIDRTPFLCRLVRQSPVFAALQGRKLDRWKRAGRPHPPPNVLKQTTVRDYANQFGCQVLVETGTYYGAMVLAMRDQFRKIYSIELDESLFARASRMFCRDLHVSIMQGDSAEKLKMILPEIDEPAVFWLDAHYSGPGTARASHDTPITTELDLILSHPVDGHVILIDDAHDFGRLADYPTIAQVQSSVSKAKPDWSCEMVDNIIRIHPRSASERGPA